jgi:hypothetical protein
MTSIQLFRPDEEYLSSQDAIRRIAPAFRHVVLDRARGEAEYKKAWDKARSLNAPEVILQPYSLANCRTVWVEVSDDDGTDGWVRFVLWPRQDINIDFANDAECARLRPTVEKLAKLLGYIAEEDEETESGQPDFGDAIGDVVMRFRFYFLPHANPPERKEEFEKALRGYFGSHGLDYGMADLRNKTETRGFVRGQDRPLTEDDRQALATWVMAERINCSVLLGALEAEVDELNLFDDRGGWVFLVDNLTDDDRAEAAGCRAVADHFAQCRRIAPAEPDAPANSGGR